MDKTMTATKILNIDELLEEVPMKIIVKGQEHAMSVVSMENFLENMKDLEALAAAPSVIAETEITIRVIGRSFPTLTEADIRKWPVTAIENLFNLIRGVDPDAQVEGTDSEGNPSSAS